MEQYASFANLIAGRHSCRSFDSRPVDTDLIRAIVDAARIAPSACNLQPWHFVAVTTDPAHAAAREAVIAAYPRPWIATAPAYIVCCGDHSRAWHRTTVDGKDATDIDLAIATEHICLAATALGLGSCWVCNFDPAPIAAALGLPEGMEPIAIIPVGYPSATAANGEHRPPTSRKPLDEILSWGRF